ncbi:MAG: N-acetylmuramoyl-L-alanine amidase [Alphaproteobacteria bacterium]|nr:N-acetylmuramoyl-L-alanine amidase [Alphaproteobacteria bacterium]
MRQAYTGCLKPLKHHYFSSIVLCAMLLLAWSALRMPYPSLAQSSGAVLADARIGEREGETRFVLEFDRAVPFKVFTLAGPDRVVIDLPSVDWKGPAQDEVKGRGLIGGYRHGLFKPGITRVVIDLAAPASVVRHFALDAAEGYGPRVVIDLGPVSKTQPSTVAMESAGWDEYAQILAKSSPAIATPGPPPGSTKRVVVLDPGHGGVDPGAISTSGIYEKKVVLSYAKALKKALEATGRYDVVMTRDRDIFIPLRDRYEVAHSVNAGLFISLHADSHNSSSLRGLSIYTLSDKASDREAEALAAKENRSDLLAGTDLTGYEADVTSILISLAQQSVKQSSAYFAEILVDEMKTSARLLRNPHRFAGFAVLKSPNIPSVLIELGYLSNKSDEASLMSAKHQAKMADGMVRSIDLYFDRKEKLERS